MFPATVTHAGTRTEVAYEHAGRTQFPDCGYVYGWQNGSIRRRRSPTRNFTLLVFAYARSLNAWGKAAKFDVVLPYTSFSGHGTVDGQPRERDMSGFGDPRFRFAMNFYGSPALSLKEFAGYRQDVIVGASLQVTAPLGQYDKAN
jgi:hypothetical protein